jgi:hypothetical protein
MRERADGAARFAPARIAPRNAIDDPIAARAAAPHQLSSNNGVPDKELDDDGWRF